MQISESADLIPSVNGNTTHHSSESIHCVKDDLQIFITSPDQKGDLERIVSQTMDNILPIFIYIIDQDILSEENIADLRDFRTIVPNEPIFFVRLDRSDT